MQGMNVIQDMATLIDPESSGLDQANASRRLGSIHPDLPVLVEKTADLLVKLNINPHESAATLNRMATGVMRELAAGPDRLVGNDLLVSLQRATSSTLVSEAAGQMHTDRAGVDMVRNALGDNHSGFGAEAIRTLQHVVGGQLPLEQMSNIDLKYISHGSYDRVSPEARNPLMALLKTDNEQVNDPTSIQIAENLTPLPADRRFTPVIPFQPARREQREVQSFVASKVLGFGRNLAHMQAAQAMGR